MTENELLREGEKKEIEKVTESEKRRERERARGG